MSSLFSITSLLGAAGAPALGPPVASAPVPGAQGAAAGGAWQAERVRANSRAANGLRSRGLAIERWLSPGGLIQPTVYGKRLPSPTIRAGATTACQRSRSRNPSESDGLGGSGRAGTRLRAAMPDDHHLARPASESTAS